MDFYKERTELSNSLEGEIALRLQSVNPYVAKKINGCIARIVDVQDKKKSIISPVTTIENLEEFQKSHQLRDSSLRSMIARSVINTAWLAYPTLNRILNLSGTFNSTFDQDEGTKVCLIEQMSPFVPAVELVNMAQLFVFLQLYKLAKEDSTQGGIPDILRKFIMGAFICNAIFSPLCAPNVVDRAHDNFFGSYLVYFSVGLSLALINMNQLSNDGITSRKEHNDIKAIIDIVQRYNRLENFIYE
jgi:hypothetical protein